MTQFSEFTPTTSVDADADTLIVSADGDSKRILPYNALADICGYIPYLGGQLVVRNGVNTSGNVDMYTVPEGYKFMPTAAVAYNGSTATATVDFNWQAYIDGSYRFLSSRTASLGSNTAQTSLNTTSIILEAGEKIGCYISDPVLNVTLKGILFKDSVPAYSPRLTTIAATNTLYTVPAGKAVLAVQGALTTGSALGVSLANQSGTSANYVVYLVPSGGSPTNNRVSLVPGTTVTNQSVGIFIGFAGLSAGDSLYFTSNNTTPGLFAWTNVFEFPA